MSHNAAWSPDFAPPPPPRTDRLRLEVLGPDVAELDYAAIMGSRVRLREELQWGKERRWPPDDFTLEDNLQDLADHYGEYERRDAYAYSVLDPSGQTCIGCIYIEPWKANARLAFWVIDEEIDAGLEVHLLRAVIDWIQSAWTFAKVVVALRPENQRGIAVVESVGLRQLSEGGLPNHVSFAWSRS